MEHEQNQTQKVLTSENKKFLGNIFSIAGIIFLLAGIMFFIGLVLAIYFRLDIIIGFIVGSLVVGIVSFGVGSKLSNK